MNILTKTKLLNQCSITSKNTSNIDNVLSKATIKAISNNTGVKLTDTSFFTSNSDLYAGLGWLNIVFYKLKRSNLTKQLESILEEYCKITGDNIIGIMNNKGSYEKKYVTSGGIALKYTPNRLDSCLCIPQKFLEKIGLEEIQQLLRVFLVNIPEILEIDAKLNRLDFYVDDYKQIVAIEKIKEAIENKNYVGKAKNSKSIEKNKLHSNNSIGSTYYLGSRQSDCYIRIYNKQKQLSLDNPLTRIEMEIKGKLVDRIGRNLIEMKISDWMHYLFNVLLGKIDFRDRSVDKNISRCPQLDWWKTFCKGEKGIRLYSTNYKSKITTLNQEQWLKESVSPYLALIYDIYELSGKGDEWLNDLIKIGRSRQNKKHKKIFNDISSPINK